MKKIIYLGIWMDHSHAYLMELKADAIITNCIVSESLMPEETGVEISQLHVDFNDSYKKEKQDLSNYYSKISDVIRNYQQVLLFGPTGAKSELFNLLDADHLFDHIKIEKKDTDKMTENQMHALIKEYFQQ